eukprot:TRINITY_DN4499_c0_g2_i1.p1 TRINITY_DN4499_c0_g2~~TRINITY_DN4499_c0_g2_i1.p1  ORF type:complete len:476 (+),score=64.79 TRINITY_DN4499_c0_g2_i1:74-1501(+)
MDGRRLFGHTWGAGGGFRSAMESAAAVLVPPSTPSTPTSSSPQNGSRGYPRGLVGAATLANIGKGHQENQDNFITSSNPSGTKCFVGVFDGHGEKGGRISEFSRNTLTKSLFNHRDLHTDPKVALEDAYDETERLIETQHLHEAAYSGTTAVVAYQHRDRLFVANVGDSRAVLGCIAGARGSELKAVDLSSDHKPSRPDEKRRIHAEGGVVQQSAVPVQTHGGGLRLVRMGPERVMDKSGFGGLAVSRSLGDLSLRPYVSSKPEVTERTLSETDKVLILGSDGVWDRLSSQEAVNIAARQADPIQAARMITNVARKRWQAETQGLLSDDITTVVVHLDHGDLAAVGAETQSHAPASAVGSASRHKAAIAAAAELVDSTAALAASSPATPLLRRRNPGLDTAESSRSSRPHKQEPHGGRDAAMRVTGGPEGFARYGERFRRHKAGGHLSLEPLRRPATGSGAGLPNHLLPPAGVRR